MRASLAKVPAHEEGRGSFLGAYSVTRSNFHNEIALHVYCSKSPVLSFFKYLLSSALTSSELKGEGKGRNRLDQGKGEIPTRTEQALGSTPHPTCCSGVDHLDQQPDSEGFC